MKENFGFIERADVVKEIFFHYSEAKTKEELLLGDDVEFIIQTRNVSFYNVVNNMMFLYKDKRIKILGPFILVFLCIGGKSTCATSATIRQSLLQGKEVACNITKLPSGSVVFEDVSPEIMRGQVLKPLERGSMLRAQNDPLPGRIRYRAADHSEVEV